MRAILRSRHVDYSFRNYIDSVCQHFSRAYPVSIVEPPKRTRTCQTQTNMTFKTAIYDTPAAWLGFQKKYNWPLCKTALAVRHSTNLADQSNIDFIFAGAMVGFSLARLEYLSPSKYANGASPGEWYWQRTGHYRVGLVMHLATVLPAGLLMVSY